MKLFQHLTKNYFSFSTYVVAPSEHTSNIKWFVMFVFIA